MPFQPHFRVTALGRLSTSGERFSYGLNMAPNNGAGSADGLGNTVSNNNAAWDDIAADIAAFHGSSASTISAFAVLETVKVARIGADGKYLDDPYVVDLPDTIGGGFENAATTRTLPQTALAVSLVTGRRGPSGKGRFYIPMPLLGISSTTFLVDAAQAGAVATAAGTLIDNMNNAPGFDATEIKVCVASTKGYNTGVTGVRVGRVIDTIRSRRAQLLENYGPTVNVA